MAKNTLLEKLKARGKAWRKAEAKEGRSPVEDGTYLARIKSATLNESKTSGREQVTIEFEVLDGGMEGRHIWNHMGLDTDEGFEWFKGLLNTLEVEIPGDISELPDTLEELKGIGCEITVKTKNEFQNVYVNELAEITEDGDEEEEAADDDDEEAADDDEDGDVEEEETEEESDEEESDEEADDEEVEEEEEEEPAPKPKKKPAPAPAKPAPKKQLPTKQLKKKK